MPIDIDNFKGGKSVDSMKEAVKKFLQSNHDKAYLATELFEVVQGRELKSTADLFEIQGVLQTLVKERAIVSRHVETKDGFQAYYCISEV